MWAEYNPNPVRTDGVGDCAVRAVAKALGISWEEAYTKLTMNGFLMGDLPNSDLVWGATLREAGFKRDIVPNTCPDCYTVGEFVAEHPSGTYVIKSPDHVATAVDGVLYDAWNSEMKVPIYYWTNRKDEE